MPNSPCARRVSTVLTYCSMAACISAAQAQTQSTLLPANTGVPQPVAGIVTGQGWVAPSSNEPMSPRPAYVATFSGRGWYIDRSAGSDANAGTQASPWRTLAPAAKLVMASGDALLLKCGEVWRESLELTSVNAPAGNVLVGAYGDCSADRRPVIRASDWLSPAQWSKVSTSGQDIYARTHSQAVDRLFSSGKPLIKARHPNFNRVGAEYAISAPATANTQTTLTVSPVDLGLLIGKDIVGSTIYVKVKQWETLKASVKAFDDGTGLITLDRSMPYVIMPGSGYILEGKPWMLDSASEWYHDQAAKLLYLATPSGVTPAQLPGIEAGWREYGLKGKWIKHLRVERLAVEQQSVDGIKLIETPDVIVSDVAARQVQELGIVALTSPRAVIQDSWVEGAGRTGIIARETEDARILRNRVVDTGGYARANGSDAAISVFGAGSVVENNYVERSASLGIRFANRSNTVVRSNTVMSFCIRFTDCAGIYTYTGGNFSVSPRIYVPAALVEYNIVVSAKSNIEGCGYKCENLALGIYLDELTHGATISNNIVSDTEVGIGILNSGFNRISKNIVRGSLVAAFRGTKTRTEAAIMRGNRVTENSFFTHQALTMKNDSIPVEATPTNAQYWFHSTDATLHFSGVDPNVISGNENVSVLKSGDSRWTFASWGASKIMKQADWKIYAPTDRQVNRVTYKQYDLTTEASLIGSTNIDPKTSLAWNPYFNPVGRGGAFTLEAFSACGKACAKLVAGSSTDYLTSKDFYINGARGQNLYVLKYLVAGGKGGGVRKAYVRRSASPWENFGLNLAPVTLAPGETIKDEAFFRATGSSSAAVLDLRGVVNGETYFSDVSLSRVRSIDFLDMKRVMSHVVNPLQQPMTFPCTALGLSTCDLIDETGARVSFPMTVAARSSRLVFARDPKWVQ